jgi:asparagine synthase (glutamine-hydrolysing)
MCGICGILGDDELDGRTRRVERMTHALAHRGPDDNGTYTDERISLGFRRLAVIELETGQQPIRLENDRAVIVLNGEIYNFRELRRELEPRHRFHSKGDVEVVLRLYAEQGIDCLRRLNGMFSLAIWDRAKRILFLARDRFGIKPLFLHRTADRLAFASELGALLAAGIPRDRRLDRLELLHYLSQKYVSPGGSILEGVRSLPPATVLQVGPEGTEEWRYWSAPTVADRTLDPTAAVAELGQRLERATHRQLVADVPVGVFLSGGVDSSTLAALVRRARQGPLSSFSVGFEGPGAVSELPAARRVADRLGTTHHELPMRPAEVAGDLDRILSRMDGPQGDATCIPTWYVSRLARRTVTVALSGEGADALFGGYPRQHYDVLLDRLTPAGRLVLPAIMRVLGRPASARLRRRLGMPPGLRRQLDWSAVFTREQTDHVAREPLPTDEQLMQLHAGLDRGWSRSARQDPLNARLEIDRELFLPGDLLPKVDRMSMAHSLEVRVPYLDNEVADWVLPLPGALKARRRETKSLLKRFSRQLLPPQVATRPKQGFDVPVSAWLRGPLREPLTDYLSVDAVRRRGLFEPQVVGSMVEEHLDGRVDHGERLWLLLALEGWQQLILDRAAPEASS